MGKYTKEAWDKIKISLVIYGGDFEVGLARLFQIADTENTKKLFDAFPEIWEKHYNYFI